MHRINKILKTCLFVASFSVFMSVGGHVYADASELSSKADEDTAQVYMIHFPWRGAKFCTEASRFKSRPNKEGYADIPADERVTIGLRHSWSDNIGTYSCKPSLSFIAEKGERYYANWGVEDYKCFIEIFKEDTSNRVGVSFVPSVGAPNCDV